MVACQHCHKSFVPIRATARFCSDRCRVASNRAKGSPPPAVEGLAPPAGADTGEVFSVTARAVANASAVTLRRRPNLPGGIVPAATYPGMFRVHYPDVRCRTW
jgi:hypothetical protein